jgi:hypothetical protein
VGKELYAGTAELARVAGWSALDMGHHALAQRHFIQALRMARAGASLAVGCHVLTNMALQATLRGYPDEAVDMAQGAYDRARHQAAPRVLAFAKLVEARAHARLGDAPSAAAALVSSERLLEQAGTEPGDEPAWIRYYTPHGWQPTLWRSTGTWACPPPPCAGTTGPHPCPRAPSPAPWACA